VTVYRNLELLVEQNLIERITIGGRAAHYGMAPNEYHAPHPHFICTKCASIDCLSSECLSVNMENLQKTFSGEVERIEVRVEGVCRNCLKGTLNKQ
jgi:Fur family ferric uptake transcriptional regulator